jgi:choline transporter-like protein 2/4/5
VILVAGVLGGVVLSMVWMTVIRYAVGFMAWGTLLIINLLFILIAVFCALKAGLIDTDNQIGDQLGEVDSGGVTDVTDGDKKVFEVATYITVGLAAVIFLFTLLLASRIKVAIAVLKVASQVNLRRSRAGWRDGFSLLPIRKQFRYYFSV